MAEDKYKPTNTQTHLKRMVLRELGFSPQPVEGGFLLTNEQLHDCAQFMRDMKNQKRTLDKVIQKRAELDDMIASVYDNLPS
jgi:hypothetical protein